MHGFLARTRIGRTLAFASVGLMMAGGIPPAEATPITWYNGFFVNTDVISSCVIGTLEIRMQGYVGYGLRPGGRTPAVGEVWYAHLVISHPGNPCSGGSATGIEFAPPPNTQLAVSAEDPIFCFYRQHNFFDGSSQSHGTVYNLAASCDQNPSLGANGYILHAINPTQPWVIPSYAWMEFLIPLRSVAVVNGNNAVARLNPAIGVFASATVPVFVNNDVMFRDGFDGLQLYLDLCTLSYTAGC